MVYFRKIEYEVPKLSTSIFTHTPDRMTSLKLQFDDDADITEIASTNVPLKLEFDDDGDDAPKVKEYTPIVLEFDDDGDASEIGATDASYIAHSLTGEIGEATFAGINMPNKQEKRLREKKERDDEISFIKSSVANSRSANKTSLPGRGRFHLFIIPEETSKL